MATVKIEIIADSGAEARHELEALLSAYRPVAGTTIRGYGAGGGGGVTEVYEPDGPEPDTTSEISEEDEAEADAAWAAKVQADGGVPPADAAPDKPKGRRGRPPKAKDAPEPEKPAMSAAEAATVMAKDAVPDEKRVLPPEAEARLRQELQNAVLEGEVGDATTLPTEDDCRLAMQKLSAKKDVAATRQLMADFGVARVSLVPPEKRREFIDEAAKRMNA